jgi:hypothetical protein
MGRRDPHFEMDVMSPRDRARAMVREHEREQAMRYLRTTGGYERVLSLYLQFPLLLIIGAIVLFLIGTVIWAMISTI